MTINWFAGALMLVVVCFIIQLSQKIEKDKKKFTEISDRLDALEKASAVKFFTDRMEK